MGLENLATSQQQTRDSIGSHPNILPIPRIKTERITIWEEPHVVYNRDISNSWIAGSSTNGIVGTWTGTAGGGQLVVGDTTNTEALLKVVCPGNTYVNFLRATPTNTLSTTTYGLLQSTSTGAINTTTNRIDLDDGEFMTWRVYKDTNTVSRAKITLSTDSERTNFIFGTAAALSFDFTFDTVFGGSEGNVTLEFSPDGGSTWYEAENDEWCTFTTPGNDLLFRITAADNSLYWKTAKTNGEETPIIISYS